MLSRLMMDFLSAFCRRQRSSSDRKGSDVSGRKEGLLWYKDVGHHLFGEYSMAVVQANNLLEDQSQIESGPLTFLNTQPYGTFLGVYDGHGGPETSRYICDNLFHHLKSNGFLRSYYHVYDCLLFGTSPACSTSPAADGMMCIVNFSYLYIVPSM